VIDYEWRGVFDNVALNALHAEGFGHRVLGEDWWGARGRGTGTGLVAVAAENARAAGCEWLHVDFEDHLRPFYFDACGFTPTNAGLIALAGPESEPAPA
jgi:hypothetical protein